MSADSNLELVVGVDLGLTCTGVAFCEAKKTQPNVIYKWPQDPKREAGRGVTYKVPTRLAYLGGRRSCVSWGFKCPDSDAGGTRELAIKEHFKLLLDPEVWNGAFADEPDLAPGEIGDVQDWLRDFLAALYEHIVSYFTEEFTREKWEKGRVQYIFSIPTTWQRKTVIEKFEEIVRDAGFGKVKGQTLTIGLSEAEAAAIYTAMYPKEHRVLSWPDESGLRTTKKLIPAYRVNSDMDSSIKLDQLSHVDGKPIGSVQIDSAFQELTENRLLAAYQCRSPNSQQQKLKEAFRSNEPRITCKFAAREMTRGDFQFHKHHCGDGLADLKEACIPVPGLGRDFDFDFAACQGNKGEEAGEAWVIKGGMMVYKKETIEELFNKQTNEIVKFIEEQLEHLQKSAPNKQVSYIVLSGGLGSSAYVQTRISSTFNSKGIEILVSTEPQLAVCKGLVIDRLHYLQSNSSALRTRLCRGSYGIYITPPLSVRKKKKEGFRKRDLHFLSQWKTKLSSNATASLNKNDNDKIHWLIKKDEPVEVVKCMVSRVVDRAHPRRAWVDEIVFSSADKNDLPTHMPSKLSADGVKPPRTIAFLESNLRDLPQDKAPFPFDSSDSEQESPSPSPHKHKSGNKGKYNDNNNKTINKPSGESQKARPKPRGRGAWPFQLKSRASAASQPEQVVINYEITVSIGPEGLDFKSSVFSNKRTPGIADQAGGDIVGELSDIDSGVYVGEEEYKENSGEGKITVGNRLIPLNWSIFPDDDEEPREEEGEDDEEGMYEERRSVEIGE
ncbi:hypothetical protein GP486_002017 [Trichoglossum hirsutum]|uniref:Actin-like ATPase domain-containing protein n=1 Tax=Trichoglossum hirsutum TaxID=265104 RepID=A0A9P8LFK3_9PEZI|nr:hypothetical protein GP486_002017 [Trichoglossum hirsutum]